MLMENLQSSLEIILSEGLSLVRKVEVQVYWSGLSKVTH